MAGPAQRYTIQGREVTMPCVVRRATSGAATFLVDAAAARRLLPTPELDVVELLPGRALASLACIDYQENDLGDYGEISVAFFVRERRLGRGIPYLGTALDLVRARLATWIHRLPVTQSFTCEAGSRIWGFPKVIHEIAFARAADTATCSWSADGRRVLDFTLPRGGARTLPDAELTTYTLIGGALHRTRFVTGAEGFGFRFGASGGTKLVLGDHPIAGELRALGLPKAPLMTTWMERMHGRFEGPEKL
jgi:hypothetical protein